MNRMQRSLGVLVVIMLGGVPPAHARSVVPDRVIAAPWVIERAEYSGGVIDQIARLEARYTIRVLQDGWAEIPLTLQGATITAVGIEQKAADAHVGSRHGTYVLMAQRKGTYRVRVACSILLVQDSQFEGIRLGIPSATFSTVSLTVPRKDVELSPQQQLYVQATPDPRHGGVTLVARLGAVDQIDLRWRTKPAAPAKIDPVIYGEVYTLVRVEEQLAHLSSIIDYRVAQGTVRTLQLGLPSGLNVLNVRGAGIEDWRVTDEADETLLTVTLGFDLKDQTYRLIIDGEQPQDGAASSYQLPEIRLRDVKQERGYLAVAREGSIELTPREIDGINRIDVKELPDAIRQADGRSLFAFKYHQHPYRVVLGLTRHQDHPVLTAIAERGELVTVLSRQGELLTRAAYLIRANKKQFLEVELPEGATLWSCLVGDKSVKPVQGPAPKLLVPIDALTDTTQSVWVELVYFERRPDLTGIGQLTLHGPVLDVPTTVANWVVYAPRELRFLRMSGNLERGAAPVDFVDEPMVLASSSPAREAHQIGSLRRDGNLVAYRGRSVREWREDNSDAVMGGAFSDARASTAGEPALAALKAQDQVEEGMSALNARLQASGVLPLKIQLPKAGRVHQFSRLMTTQEALTLNATFVHLPMPWMPTAALGLLLFPVGGLAVFRRFHL